MDEFPHVPDERKHEGSEDSQDAALEDSRFGAASRTLDAFDKKAPWIGNIFLSYSSPDRTRTNGIRKLLEGMGHRVFHDHESIAAGSRWRTYLATALKQADCVALYWTKHAQRSKWVREEYETFTRMKPDNPLIPIYGDRKLPLPPLLSEHQVVDLGYVPDEKEKKGGGVAILGAARLADQINGSIDTALSIARRLRKAGKSAAGITQGVVTALKEQGYPVSHPDKLKEGLRALGGFGWLPRITADPLAPVRKPLRWAKEAALRATPPAVGAAVAAGIVGVITAPVITDWVCRPLAASAVSGWVGERCASRSVEPPPPGPTPPVINNNYYTSTPEVFPYTFDREFRAIRERADLIVELVRDLALGRPGRDGARGLDGLNGRDAQGWPYWHTGTQPTEWPILFARWEADGQRRRHILATLLAANLAQTDTILQALAATRQPPVDLADPSDYGPILGQLLEGMDDQGARLAAIEDHLARLRVRSAANTTAETPGPMGEGGERGRDDTGLGEDFLRRIEEALARGDTILTVEATRREFHYFLLPYSVAQPGVLGEDDGLDELRDVVRERGGSGGTGGAPTPGQGDASASSDADTGTGEPPVELGLSVPQARTLLLPYRAGTVSVLGIKGHALDPVIDSLHRFMLTPGSDSLELTLTPEDARLLVMPYTLRPLPPGVVVGPVQDVVDAVNRQVGLETPPDGDERREEESAPSAPSAPDEVTLQVTRAQAPLLIQPHIFASPAALLETYRDPRSGIGRDAQLDLALVLERQDEANRVLRGLDARTRGGLDPVTAGELALLSTNQERMQRTLDSLRILLTGHVTPSGGSSGDVAPPVTSAAGVASATEEPGHIRYVRPAAEGVFKAPVGIDTVPPAYPEAAIRDGLQGIVDVEAVIETDGSVRVVRTAAASGLGLLEAVAFDRVGSWRFHPGTLNGDSIAVPLRVSLSFELATATPEPGRR